MGYVPLVFALIQVAQVKLGRLKTGKMRGYALVVIDDEVGTYTDRIIWTNVRGFQLVKNLRMLAAGEGRHLQRIDTGHGYTMALLNLLLPKGEVYWIEQSDVHLASPSFGDEWSLVWANADAVTYLWFKGASGWDPKRLGLMLKSSPKLGKRLKELAKIYRFYRLHHGNTPRVLVLKDPDLVEGVDGASIMAPSYVRSLARSKRDRGLLGKAKSGSIRILTSTGLIKGDFIVAVSDEVMAGYDVITFESNVKDEMALSDKDKAMTGVMLHHDHHEAATDIQTLSWMGELLFPVEQLRTALIHKGREVLNALQAGEFPQFMVHASIDDGENQNDMIHQLQNTYHKWTAAGRSLKESAYFLFMMTQGFMNHMRKGMRFPIPWAVYSHIMSTEMLIIAGYAEDVKKANGKVFYHQPTGRIVLPGAMIRDLFKNHGGWDLDDSVRVLVRKFEDGIRGIMLRSPNAYGEYSIVEIDFESFKPVLYNTVDAVPEIAMTVDQFYTERPTIHNLKVTYKGLPAASGLGKSDEYTPEVASATIEALQDSPGTGKWANSQMMVWPTLLHYGTLPYRDHQLAPTEDIVDLLQQTPDIAGFQVVLKDIDESKALIARIGFIERYFVTSKDARISAEWCEENGVQLFDGHLTALLNAHNWVMNKFNESARKLSNSEREVIPELMAVQVTPKALAWADKAIKDYVSETRQLTRQGFSDVVVGQADGTERIVKKSLASDMIPVLQRGIMDQMDKSATPEMGLAALYQVTQRRIGYNQKKSSTNMGDCGDRILFQQGPRGEEMIIDRLIAYLATL
jgi:hypothetical protein